MTQAAMWAGFIGIVIYGLVITAVSFVDAWWAVQEWWKNLKEKWRYCWGD